MEKTCTYKHMNAAARVIRPLSEAICTPRSTVAGRPTAHHVQAVSAGVQEFTQLDTAVSCRAIMCSVYRLPTSWGAESALCHSKITKFFMTNCGQQAFSYAGPHAWNSLPEHLRQSTSIDLFKRSLKTFYTGRYRVQCIRDICLMGYISLLTYLQTPNCRRRRNDKSIGQ